MQPLIDFGRDRCADPDFSSQREWLITNGLGGYASGTISGILTRKYHGLLIAAVNPPLGRMLLVAKLDEAIYYRGIEYQLFSNRKKENSVSPKGFQQMKRFHLEGTTPVWTYEIEDARIEKRIWMEPQENTTYINFQFSNRSGAPIQCKIDALINYRDHHSITKSETAPHFNLRRITDGVQVVVGVDQCTYYLKSSRGEINISPEWQHGFYLAAEAYRGEAEYDDLLRACKIEATIHHGQELTLAASTNPNVNLDFTNAYAKRIEYEYELLRNADLSTEKQPAPVPNPKYVVSATAQQQLTLAADQFIAKRCSPKESHGHTVIAGYPWFGDWGRDTMISLPGLTLTTGRADITKSILRTFADYVDCGMLPNRFPDFDEEPEYNTVDATLWYFEAIRATYRATGDKELLKELYPVLQDIIHWHIKGTRYQICVDPDDNLLYSGQEGVQLTWMDAKVDDLVVTPRIGKAIEVNALWYNALKSMDDFTCELGYMDDLYQNLSEGVSRSFQRFWNKESGYCFDVIDTPAGNDPTLRPNQLIALSLTNNPLTIEQSKSILEICEKQLLTGRGLRSLATFEKAYIGVYGGDRYNRDKAYHQGTVWAWLIGPFLRAHWNIHQDRQLAITILRPLLANLQEHGLGSISEIFDGDPPHTPRGCIAQAWSVAEIIQILDLLNLWNSDQGFDL